MDAKDRRIAELEKRVAELEALLKAALAKIAQLEKNSSNSSKPPSSDIVKPPNDKDRRRKKKIGAQKGHKQNLRTPFPEDQIDQTIELTLDSCPKCGGALKATDKQQKFVTQGGAEYRLPWAKNKILHSDNPVAPALPALPAFMGAPWAIHKFRGVPLHLRLFEKYAILR